MFTDDCELDYGEIGAWTSIDAIADFMERVHALAGHTPPGDDAVRATNRGGAGEG